MKKSFFKKMSQLIAIGKCFTKRIDIVIYYKVIGEELMLSNCAEGSWEPLGLLGDQMSQSLRKSTLSIYWKDCCWSWSSSPLATWVEESTHWKTPWCWERLRAEGEGGDRGWDGWMASPTQWTWVWATLGDSGGQRCLGCGSAWSWDASGMT